MSARTKLVLAVVSSLLVVFTIQQIFFPVLPIDRKELLGARTGESKSEVLRALAANGVDFVLPEVQDSTVIGPHNLRDLPKLNTALGVCIGNYAKGTSAKFNFDPSAGQVGLVQQSVHPVPELAGITSRSELMARLPDLMRRNPDIEAFACMPHQKWVAADQAMSGIERSELSRYDHWLVNVPGGYSVAEFKFASGKLARITYRWRLFESN